jgi:NAD(P)-dependent dehydrogenase (short-subunit alcohol dehydrogenase family)
MSLFDMTGQVALITGSSRGIGRAIAEEMAEQGAKVVISSRKQQPCDEVAAALNAKHGEGTAIAVPANISSKEELQNLVDETRKAFGKITALVCNAASNPYYGPSLGISDDQFRKIMDNNILSNHWLMGMVAPEMVERGEGSITIISSIGGLKGSNILGAYCISKAAPGLIQTDMARALWENPDNLEVATRRSPLRRIGQPYEIAGAAVFLASKAGGFTTGQTIVIDGGNTSSGG